MTAPDTAPRQALELLADWLEAELAWIAAPMGSVAECNARDAVEPLYTALLSLDPASLRWKAQVPPSMSLEDIWTQNADLYTERAAAALADGNEPLATLWTEHARNCREGVIALRAQAEAAADVEGLHPETAALVDSFALELKRKLRRAEEKYGYDNGWKQDDWKEQCRIDLMRHIEKGDPRDVAAYCAFMWHHGWSTGSSRARAIRAAAHAEHDRIGYSYDHISIDLHEDVDRRMEIALTASALAQAGGEG